MTKSSVTATSVSSSKRAVGATSHSGASDGSMSLVTSSNTAGTIATTGILDYVRVSLPRLALLELYTDPTRGKYVCRAVLQQLTSIAAQIVLRLTCTGGSFVRAGIQVWMHRSTKQQSTIFVELYQWAIIVPPSEITTSSSSSSTNNVISSPEVISLTPEFYKGLQDSLCCLDSSPWVQLNRSQLDELEKEAGESHKKYISPEDLERYTVTQWDTVLHFLVGTTGQKEPPPEVVHFLLETGLMQADPEFVGDEDDAPLVITQKGYDFMLQDNHQQVWHFVVQYLKSLESRSKKGSELRKEAVLLLICLSFARVGEAYLGSSLTKDLRVMTKDLALFGLLYIRKIGKATIFYPTRIAMQLVGNASATGSDLSNTTPLSAMWSLSSKALESALAHPRPQESSHLAIIVQTNFQLCAYTSNELHVSMLGLFCDVQTIRRLPNVVFMSITRDSVKGAFQLGIQARQILRFLEKHAHPKLRTNTSSPIPGNVIDQIWLWDRERSRVRFTEVYQHQCLMPGEFAAVQLYAQDRCALAWSSEQKQLLYLDYQHVKNIELFVRNWRAKAVARQQEVS